MKVDAAPQHSMLALLLSARSIILRTGNHIPIFEEMKAIGSLTSLISYAGGQKETPTGGLSLEHT